MTETSRTSDDARARFSVLRAFAPYVLVVLLLILTRTVAPVKAFLTGPDTTLRFANLFGTPQRVARAMGVEGDDWREALRDPGLQLGKGVGHAIELESNGSFLD